MNRILDVLGVIFLLAGLASLVILLYKMFDEVTSGDVIGYLIVMVVSIIIGVVHILLAGFIGPRKY